MPINIEMPKLSDTMTEGTVVRWLKKEGEEIEIGDIIAEIETDKATMEMEAFDEGTLSQISVAEGGKAPVGSVIAVLTEDGEEEADEPTPPAHEPEQPIKLEEAPATITAALQEASATINNPENPSSEAGGRIIASPLARKIAEAYGIDLSKITGTGPGGRIVKADLEGPPAEGEQPVKLEEAPAPAIEPLSASEPEPEPEPTPTPAPAAPAPVLTPAPHPKPVATPKPEPTPEPKPEPTPAPQPEPTPAPAAKAAPAPSPAAPAAIRPVTSDSDTRIELSGMRKIIAERLLVSKTTIPHFYLHLEVDAAPLMKLRTQINVQAEATHGNKYSVNDFVVKALVEATKAVPEVNASFNGDHIVQFSHVGISVAIAVDEGLVTPVVKQADKKSLLTISTEIKEMAVRARDKKLAPNEFDGGTVTISNLGAWGIESFDAIVNPPQAAILSVGGIADKPVVENGEIVAGKRMNLGVSCDHRVVDGAVAAKFLGEIKRLLEQPTLMLI